MKKYLDYDGAKVLVNKSLESFAPIEHKHNVADIEDYVAPTQSDWSENDETSPSHILNRIGGYTEQVEVLYKDNEELDFTTTNQISLDTIGEYSNIFEVGNQVTVIFDGVEYITTVKETSFWGTNWIYIGNLPIFTTSAGVDDTGEPFVLWRNVSNTTSIDFQVREQGRKYIVSINCRYVNMVKIPLNMLDTVGKNDNTAYMAEIFNDYEKNKASSSYSHAEGFNTTASGQSSHAEGCSTTASGNYSHAEGFNVTASGEDSHVEGESTTASGSYSHAEGSGTTASGASTHAEGYGTTAVFVESHAEGAKTTAFGARAHIEGYSSNKALEYITTESTNDEILAVWETNKFALVKGTAAHVEGQDCLTLNDYSHAEGNKTIASGVCSHTEGEEVTASGASSHAEGFRTKATGNFSHTEGYGTIASEMASHAEGLFTIASGQHSHAEGWYAIASGDYSHVEGERTTTIGGRSHAEGQSTNKATDYITNNSTNDEIVTAWYNNNFSLAKGEASHTEGKDNLALGGCSHAEGSATTASGSCSHAEGGSSTASGNFSHAEGSQTTASGKNSHAEGYITMASGDSQHVQGKYNIEDTEDKYAHIVGNGTSYNALSNAHTLDWNGNGWYAGSLYVGGTSQNDAVRVATLDDITKYNQITMVDEDNGYDYVVAMKNGTLVSYCACTSIAITTLPSKTEYASGDTFDPTDMVVTATCQDGNTREITNYTYTETVTNSPVVISYVEREITYTAEVTVTIV